MQVFNLEFRKNNNNNNNRSGVFGLTDVAASRATSAGGRRIYLGFEFFGDLYDWFLCFVGIRFILFPVQLLSGGHERALQRTRFIRAEGFLQKRKRDAWLQS